MTKKETDSGVANLASPHCVKGIIIVIINFSSTGAKANARDLEKNHVSA